MPLDPFSLAPAGPLDRLAAYWYATVNRYVYDFELTVPVPGLLELPGPVEEVFHQPFVPFRSAILSLHYHELDTTLTVLQGVTEGRQLALQLLLFGLLPSLTFPGRVSEVMAVLAINAWSLLGSHLLLGRWVVSGHSQGGAIAGLLCSGPSAFRPALCVDFASPRVGDWTHRQAQTVPRLRITNQGDPVPLLPPQLDRTARAFGLLRAPTPAGVAIEAVLQLIAGFVHWGSWAHLWADGSVTRPVETPTGGDVVTYLWDLIHGDEGGWVGAHYIPEYCRRLRAGIPVPFPLTEPDPDFPGLDVIDNANLTWNQVHGIDWPTAAGSAPVFALPVCGA